MTSVTFLSTGLAYGGAEVQVVQLARGLSKRGYEVGVISMLPPRAFSEELRAGGIRFGHLGMRRGLPDPRAILRLRRILRTWRPDVLHSQMVHANLLGRLVRPLAPVPVLVSTAQNAIEGARWRERAYRFTDRLADVTTNVSEAAVRRFVEVGAAPADRIRFVPNGVDVERFRPDPQVREAKRAELAVEGFVWLAVGRLEEQKDYPTLLRAFERASHASAAQSLLIVGQGELREPLERQAATLGIADRVRFLGLRTDVQEVLKAADAYVMSSAWEGLPMVLLEAGATALPIVTTDGGGSREAVADHAHVVPTRQPEALGAAMARMACASPGALRAMGEANRAHVVSRFSLGAVLDTWEAIYAELIAHQRRTS